MQTALLLIGGGSNGKSLFLELVTRMIGYQNIATRDWTSYGVDDFAYADLYNKSLAFDDDIRVTRPLSDNIKKLVTEGWANYNAKYKDAFPFQPYATWIGAINRLPTTRDATYGFFRRFLPIEFLLI